MRPGIFSNPFVRFVLSAAFLYFLFFLLHQFVVKVYTYYDQRFIGLIINSTDYLLQMLGYTTFKVLQDRDLQVLGIDGSNGVWVGSNCNAISLFYLFAVFIIAYPGKPRQKIWFIPAGIVAIHFLNIVRVAALAMIANHYPYALDFNHTYTFTFLVYAFIFSLWLIWVNKIAEKPLSAS